MDVPAKPTVKAVRFELSNGLWFRGVSEVPAEMPLSSILELESIDELLEQNPLTEEDLEALDWLFSDDEPVISD